MELSEHFEKLPSSAKKALDQHHCLCVYSPYSRCLGFQYFRRTIQPSMQHRVPNRMAKCQGSVLPSIDGPGVLVQMVHRFGAGIVGLVLILTSAKIRTDVRNYGEGTGFSTATNVVTGFWMLNVLIGGMYIVLADPQEFPEFISLLHLVFGVTSFIAAAVTLMMLRLAYLRIPDPHGGSE